MNATQIKFYRKNQFGTVREFIHPDNAGQAAILLALTGNRTIDGRVRELIRDLTQGALSFVEVLAP